MADALAKKREEAIAAKDAARKQKAEQIKANKKKLAEKRVRRPSLPQHAHARMPSARSETKWRERGTQAEENQAKLKTEQLDQAEKERLRDLGAPVRTTRSAPAPMQAYGRAQRPSAPRTSARARRRGR